ncbi:MAG TPA: FliH/SctL family protein, partial [Bryobacteraceae bacterium]|nr:FliH/SctL family protein [Bryobacteraceae bacterium]
AIREQVDRTVAELAQVRPQLFHQAEGDLVRLSLEIARRIVHRELRAEPEAVHALVRHALEKVQGQETYRVRAHPDEATRLRGALENLGQGQLEVTGDASLRPGAILFETSRGDLDASIETQFREIERGLADRLERRSKA